MSAVATAMFTGFRPEAIQFLADLSANNDRNWFQPRKADYERLLKEPLAALCADLAEQFEARGIPLVSDPVRSPFRIYRDIRFSKDKAPYKTNVGASFPWAERRQDATGDAAAQGEGRHSVGGYFHFQPGEVFVGGGMWHPEPARLTAFRQAVANDADGVASALDDPAFKRTFGNVHGDELKRVPTGYPADHPRADLLRLKDVVFSRRLSDKEATSPNLPDLITDTLADGVPVFRFLARL
jgi:uncharacterized protein (TIGR02453 family)